MEGRAVAVTETVVLPAQPAAGTVEFVPLGGDGLSAPRAAYAVKGFLLTGDVSGGQIQTQVTMDDRYTSIVSYVSFNMSQATSADVDFNIAISGARTPQMTDSGVAVAISSTIDAVEVRHTWLPPPQLLPGGTEIAFVRTKVLNVDSDVLRSEMWIYLFNIDVRQKTPMGPLLWARGST